MFIYINTKPQLLHTIFFIIIYNTLKKTFIIDQKIAK